MARPPRRCGPSEAGFSLVEVLIGLAITAMVTASVTTALMTIATSARRDQEQTDQYEQLRMVAQMITEDGRFAFMAETASAGSKLYLYDDDTGNDYVLYTFRIWDGSANGLPDPEGSLHRWEIRGGGHLDQVVAVGLAPPKPADPNATVFTAEFVSDNRNATARLVAKPLPGQATPTRLQVYVLQR